MIYRYLPVRNEVPELKDHTLAQYYPRPPTCLQTQQPGSKGPSQLYKSEAHHTPPPSHDEIVIKNGAVAINPIDWIKVDMGNMVFPWLKCPCILGTDIAGEVVEVGREVTRFKVGDRVVAHAVGTGQKYNTATKGAFQTYTVCLPHMTAHIPASMSYEEAAVMPLGLSTAACGLFQTDQLALQSPSPTGKAASAGKTLLIWGGSTSVGSNAIQLAVAAGYEVITTCSPKNFDYVKKLGAAEVFDYNSPTVVLDIVAALKINTTAGALSIGRGAAEACMDILHQCKGDKFIALASYPTPPTPYKYLVLLRTVWYFGSWMAVNWYKSKTRGIRTRFIVGSSSVDGGVGKMIYEDFLPVALAEGRFLAVPPPHVVGTGLEKIQTGFEVQRQGMSAKKVVISL
jgi:NADPH:quinone reductase-like Zn-dependent oxidoreductase